MLTGDFNSDGKTDFVTYSTELDTRMCLYIQKDSGSFDIQIKYLPGYVQALKVVDNNHDGKDDIVVDIASNWASNNRRILVYPQSNNGITSQSLTQELTVRQVRE
ncbi:MAG: VCBS repeat-containing protein [Bacteroidetes bacterium]|nr:VCBS repeat-containing protein [Bacteroidota bacterium]